MTIDDIKKMTKEEIAERIDEVRAALEKIGKEEEGK